MRVQNILLSPKTIHRSGEFAGDPGLAERIRELLSGGTLPDDRTEFEPAFPFPAIKSPEEFYFWVGQPH